MVGWMLIFALMIIGGTLCASSGVGLTFTLTFSAVFGFLLLVSALTLLVRSRTR
jgi:hypothetical protein